MWEWRTIARSPRVRSAIAYREVRRSGMADRQEVECAVEIAGPEAEVAGVDRGDEAIVEGAGEMESPMDVVPADPDGELMGAELAGVEDAEDLHSLEVPAQQVAVLGGVVLAQVPGVLRLLGSGGREREPVRGRDVGDRRHLRDPSQQAVGLVDVLDRLQEDDGIDTLVEVLDESSPEAQVGAPVARSRVLEGF